MNGAVIVGTPISVDFWRVRRCVNSRLFFLSHFHTDHTVGLTSAWNSYKIYCSKQTAALLVSKLCVKSEFVVGLPTGESVVLNVDERGSQTITVTLLDAHHCPGSVMFLFEGYFGTILYTGDFRYVEDVTQHPCLHGKVVDVLYLDNTYCNPACEFPSRTDAGAEVVNLIRRYPGFRVKLGLRHLGKETLLVKIALALQCWIGVDAARMETLKLLEMPDVFTCDMESTLVSVVTRDEISKKSLYAWNESCPTIAIIPTALYLGSGNPYQTMEGVFVVPYSDHSSYSELIDFVSVIKPRKIVPIVGKPQMPSTMSFFDDFLDRSPAPPPCPIPLSVREYMGSAPKSGYKSRVSNSKRHSWKSSRVKPCGVMFDESPEKDQGRRLQNSTEMPLNSDDPEAPDEAVHLIGQGSNPMQGVGEDFTEQYVDTPKISQEQVEEISSSTLKHEIFPTTSSHYFKASVSPIVKNGETAFPEPQTRKDTAGVMVEAGKNQDFEETKGGGCVPPKQGHKMCDGSCFKFRFGTDKLSTEWPSWKRSQGLKGRYPSDVPEDQQHPQLTTATKKRKLCEFARKVLESMSDN